MITAGALTTPRTFSLTHKLLDVAVLIKTDSEWHRNVIHGLAQFSNDSGGYRFTIPKADKTGEVLLPERWTGDGIVCRLTSPAQFEQILVTDLPCVNTSWLAANNLVPKVVSNEAGCANLAASHFLDKQFDNLAYVGVPPWSNYGNIILQTLSKRCGEHRANFFNFENWSTDPDQHGIHSTDLEQWLRSLPQPTAIVCWSSYIGYLVCSACQSAEIAVPRSISILCIEHDPFWSALSPVPLSYIDQDPHRVGYQAGKLLKELMIGQPKPSAPILVPPISVVKAMSSDASAGQDPILRLAINYIHEHAVAGLTVKELVNTLGVSRRMLETKFNERLRCSPAVYIRTIQLQLVARALRTTDDSISKIAAQTGFAYPEVMMRSFKRQFGVTPMQFRGAGGASSSDC